MAFARQIVSRTASRTTTRVVGRNVKAVATASSAARSVHRNLSTARVAVRTNQRQGHWNGRQSSQQQRQQRASSSKPNLKLAFAGVAGAVVAAAVANEVEADSKVDYEAVKADLVELYDSNMDYDDGSYGPVMVRLAWHCAGSYQKSDNSGGSNGATMRFLPESGYGGNAGLDVARNKLEGIKAKHPGLTYADLYTLAGALAIEHMGGPQIPWQPGRSDATDGSVCQADGRLPDAAQGESHIRDIFYRMGFDDQEIVALSGAHALGRCHTNRSGFDGPWTRAPTTFSNEYFRLLVDERWEKRRWNGPIQYENVDTGRDLMMLPSDIALIRDPTFAKYVKDYAKDGAKFERDFAAAFSKLLELGVPRDAGAGAGWVSDIFSFLPGKNRY